MYFGEHIPGWWIEVLQCMKKSVILSFVLNIK